MIYSKLEGMLLQSMIFYLEQAASQYKLFYSMYGNRASRPEPWHCKLYSQTWATWMWLLGELIKGQVESSWEMAKKYAFL